MSECEIIKVFSKENKLTPKLVNFQNGQPHNTNKLVCKSFTDPKNNKTIVAVASDRLTYVGEENDNDQFYTLLALRNKKTNKVRIVPVNTVSMNVYMSKANALLDSTLSSNKMKVGDLYKQFGSKKSKRRTEQLEKMKMDISNVEEELKCAVADITIKEDELITQDAENLAEYRPKINRNASNVENIYDLYQIISKNELNSLKDIATSVIENSVIDEQLSVFALDCINKLKQASSTDVQKYEIILYCDAILKFFKLSSIAVKKKLKIPPYPDIILDKILKEYTIFSDNSRHRPLTMRDKAVCYIIVLALIAMNYKLDLNILTQSISVGIKKLGEVARILGAQSLSNNKTMIVLKLPLPAPVTGFKRGKKRK